MSERRGYYSLIQYCPDLGRLEAANVGVLLYCPEPHFLRIRMAHSNARIRRFFGNAGYDWQQVNSFKRGLEDRIGLEGDGIRSLKHLEEFIARRANLLQLTHPRPMKVADPKQDLEALYNELVGAGRRRTGTPILALRHLLDGLFRAPDVARKIRRDIRVTVHALEKVVEIPFGFQNGRFNLITPVPFVASEPEGSIATACRYAVQGRSLYETPDPQFGALQLVLVGKFRSGDSETPRRVKRVLQDFPVKLFQDTDLPELVEEIRTRAVDLEPACYG